MWVSILFQEKNPEKGIQEQNILLLCVIEIYPFKIFFVTTAVNNIIVDRIVQVIKISVFRQKTEKAMRGKRQR